MDIQHHKRQLTNLIAILIICIGGFTLASGSANAYHAHWHEGPSCDTCHCDPGQECIGSTPDSPCECTDVEDDEEEGGK